MKENKMFFLIICMVAIFSSCESYDLEGDGLPSVTTSAVTSASAGSVTCGGNVTSDGGNAITARGVCWSTSENPTISNSKTTDGTGTGVFTSAFSGLSLNTTYYARTYATNSEGTVYGKQFVFIFDIDGNLYHTVKIGTQEWLVENLKTTRYRNGDAIPNVTNDATWAGLTTGAYCNYDNDIVYSNTYGRLYNWFVVNDGRNIAPTGWHVSSDNDWLNLVKYVGGSSIAGKKLKSLNGWYSDGNGTNNFGFNALPGGWRWANTVSIVQFNDISEIAQWWTSNESSGLSAWTWGLVYGDEEINNLLKDKKHGYSIRCVKD